VQRPQDLPDMAVVVAYAKVILDQARHPRAAPQRSRKAVGFGALQHCAGRRARVDWARVADASQAWRIRLRRR